MNEKFVATNRFTFLEQAAQFYFQITIDTTNTSDYKNGYYFSFTLKSLRLRSCDHQGQGYIGTFLSKELSFFTKVKVSMFILHYSEDTDRKKHYIVTMTFQGHPRSKVMVPNE